MQPLQLRQDLHDSVLHLLPSQGGCQVRCLAGVKVWRVAVGVLPALTLELVAASVCYKGLEAQQHLVSPGDRLSVELAKRCVVCWLFVCRLFVVCAVVLVVLCCVYACMSVCI